MLIKAIPDYKDEINSQRDNREQLKLIIHKIHGALRYLGAPALTEIISETNNQLFELSEKQLGENIERIFIEFERIIEQEKYTN